MKNPYKILEVSQNATKKEIIQGSKIAMKQRKYSLHEIASAVKQLLNPSKRLIADLMCPSKIKAKRPRIIKIKISPTDINLDYIDENAFDSLK